MAELIAVGNTTSAWADVTVAAGSSKALFLKGAAGTSAPAPAGVVFEIAHKSPAGDYHKFEELTASNIVQKGLISAPGTFGVRRMASVYSAGMDVEG